MCGEGAGHCSSDLDWQQIRSDAAAFPRVSTSFDPQIEALRRIPTAAFNLTVNGSPVRIDVPPPQIVAVEAHTQAGELWSMVAPEFPFIDTHVLTLFSPLAVYDGSASALSFPASGAESNGVGFCHNGRENCEEDMIEVPATSLDEFLPWEQQRVDILKIDTEGGEPRALFGARQMLAAKQVGVLIFEVHQKGGWAYRSLGSVVHELDHTYGKFSVTPAF